MAKPIMIQGTMSNTGKSLITAGLCRIFRQDGYRVAPFKSQNMALNSFITKEGLEMGRAQVMQAEAAGIEPSVLMNPILLKPTNETGSQVIVNGEVLGIISAENYYNYKQKLRPMIRKSYQKLAADYDIIVIEGAGSPAEINLNSDDLVNMGMAKIADSPVILAGDIDRGGVFASLYGTIALLKEEEQKRIKGVIINKFRGDVSILKPGLTMLEDLIMKPVLGVVPYMHLDIDDEDSLSERLEQKNIHKPLDIVVIRLPYISNFTDFNALSCLEPVGLRYVDTAFGLGDPDLIILPGTKNTMHDLLWLRQNGLEAIIKRLSVAGKPVIGICGGYQMLGMTLSDPGCVEQGGSMRGMELLNTDTVFEAEKVRTRISGNISINDGIFSSLHGITFDGYEIHMGRTVINDPASTFSVLSNGQPDGAVYHNVMGSYVHGLFDGDLAVNLTKILLRQKGLEDSNLIGMMDMEQYKNKQYDNLATALRQSLDMEKIYDILHEGCK